MEAAASLKTESDSSPVGGFLRKTLRLFLDPRAFFRVDLGRMSVSDALTFGLINAWIAAVFTFFVQTLNSFLVNRVLERWMQNLLASESGFSLFGIPAESFLYSAGALVLGPYFFLLHALFATIGLFLFARLLIEDSPSAPEPVTFSGLLRIEAAVLASQWFAIVPVFGGIIAFLVALVLTVAGIRERFGVSTRRAFAVVAAPYLLLLFLVLLAIFLFVVLLAQMPLQDLMQIDPGAIGG
jgi:hypothetical protein